MVDFIHLHVHSQYSILDGACRIPDLIEKAVKDGMKGSAITDHGNLFAAKIFLEEASKVPGFKPIIGCETYVARRSRNDKSDKVDAKGDHLILLAKNLQGYNNLMKLISTAWIEGFYYKPRIDKELLFEHSEGLIVSTACLAGEIARAIIDGNYDKAEAVIHEFRDHFGDDFYLELMRHPATDKTRSMEVFEKQTIVNNVLIAFAEKTGIKLLATNDVHFLNERDADAHDRLLCLNTGKDLTDPTRLRYTGQEWFKTRIEMQELFRDIPEALENTMEVFEKIESYTLNRDPVMPDFPLPADFTDANDYLRHVTYEGAAKRYPEITASLRERIDFELAVIKKMGYPGYFLIVQDLLNAARDMGVSVGPGRGSAAGSVVAFATRITDIDPLKYDLLFERFLNPDRVSMPDIDIDFDEDGRDKVLKWVVEKYGSKKVAQIITFGTMAAKMAIRDIARVQNLPLPEANHIAKLVPERQGVSLKKAYEEVPELDEARRSSNPLVSETLRFAETLEGSVRHTGIHACGIIIGKENLIDYIPLIRNKDSEYLVTQFDGKHIEEVGMLKMDFLGLKTLSIISDTIKNIKQTRGEDIDIDAISFEDELTYKLFSLGKTTGIFQFESDGMKKYLKELKPDRLEDLIAMNALYRPGPMEYIPRFIARKFGREKIVYDLPVMEKILKETYGITVYQEQVMLLSQELAGFTKGQADSLRKAMGKKIRSMLDDLKQQFVEGCRNNGYDPQVVLKIWKDWEAFANYAFNKSHSTCYAYVSYRMAYLKAHYPGEFMAAVLTRNMNDIKEITNFLEECKRMDIPVLGPDVNESELRFTVNKKGEIRFGMAGIKNVGENAATSISEERKKKGLYKDIIDFARRVDLRTVNRRSMESLAKAGAFDSFEGTHRAQFFCKTPGEDTIFLDRIIRYTNEFITRSTSKQHSLFGEDEEVMLPVIQMPDCPPWSKMEQLQHEKEITGFYMSGHPLDDYKLEIEQFCTIPIGDILFDMKSLKGKEIAFAGMVTASARKIGKNGKPYGNFEVEDYFDSMQLNMFAEDFLKAEHLLKPGTFVFIKARIDQRFDIQDQLTVRVSSVMLLSEVFEKYAKFVTVIIPLPELNAGLIESVEKLAEDNKGACKLKIQVVDMEEDLAVDLPSKSFKVDAKEFIKSLEKITPVSYRVNN